jgi:hypothetical protein
LDVFAPRAAQGALEEALVYVRAQLAQSSPFDPLFEQWMRMHAEASVSELQPTPGSIIFDTMPCFALPYFLTWSALDVTGRKRR